MKTSFTVFAFLLGLGAALAAEPDNPFQHVGSAPEGLRVQLALPDDAVFEILVVDLEGNLQALRTGRGHEEVVVPTAMLPSGLYVMSVRTETRKFSRLILR